MKLFYSTLESILDINYQIWKDPDINFQVSIEIISYISSEVEVMVPGKNHSCLSVSGSTWLRGSGNQYLSWLRRDTQESHFLLANIFIWLEVWFLIQIFKIHGGPIRLSNISWKKIDGLKLILRLAKKVWSVQPQFLW